MNHLKIFKKFINSKPHTIIFQSGSMQIGSEKSKNYYVLNQYHAVETNTPNPLAVKWQNGRMVE